MINIFPDRFKLCFVFGTIKKLLNQLKVKIRNPFRDKWLRWKDDATLKEKLIWTVPLVLFGNLTGYLIVKLIKYFY